MNKELEEFKKEIAKKLHKMKETSYSDGISLPRMIELLVDDLKPKPEFVEGEYVFMFDKEETPHNVRIFSSIAEDEDCFKFKDAIGVSWKYCEKIDALPMNMTKYDGTNEPQNDCVVVFKDKEGDYGGGLSRQMDWDERIKEFQILKDLNS